MDLDAAEHFGDVDGADALGDVEHVAAQWSAARDLPAPRLDLDGIDQVLLTGVGGSGVIADIVGAVADAVRLPVPVLAHRGFSLPAFARSRTLVVAVSYSGNTEETRSSVQEALARGCPLFAVASGGEIAQVCEANAVPWVRVPGGGMPRHSTGWLLVPVLAALGLDDGLDEAIAQLRDVGARGGRNVPTSANRAKALAARIAATEVPVVWGGRGLASVAAYRLKCQLNENAKMPALHGELPEVHHNEVCAWEHQSVAGRTGLLLVRDPGGEHPRLAARFDATGELLGGELAWVEQVHAQGDAPIARLASLLALVDLVSVYTALALDRDPTPIAFIERLKGNLADSNLADPALVPGKG